MNNLYKLTEDLEYDVSLTSNKTANLVRASEYKICYEQLKWYALLDSVDVLNVVHSVYHSLPKQ